ncbi:MULTISPECIES: hypothetical protein [Leptospira]|uniref:Uncharacterized protein n=1 Tax=Leptospira santarosai TaxID=28183 RepID=A0AB73LP11_9LEPT|nr:MULTISPECIES: hypothetical protein [Leptospira]AVV48712.1 Uncharacterized protein XB17_00087 [Leptospira santarosai]EMI61616.1 hypothetical protein LEP1GSC076_3641 [Leptospira sp. Fiocruz LV4135]ONF94090.1 hypothetical protein BWD14_05575 [Leptospira santarosai]
MNNDQKTEPKSFKLWLKIIWLKIRGTRFTHFWIRKWKTGGILIKNYWSRWRPGFPLFLADGTIDEATNSWQLRLGLFGFVLVIFNTKG